MPITLDSSNFEQEVLKSDLPVLVDFWAPWCGPCRAIAPMLDELDAESAGRYKIGKVNVDENGDLAMSYNASSIPLLLVFHNGEVVESMVGVRPKNEIQAALEAVTA